MKGTGVEDEATINKREASLNRSLLAWGRRSFLVVSTSFSAGEDPCGLPPCSPLGATHILRNPRAPRSLCSNFTPVSHTHSQICCGGQEAGASWDPPWVSVLPHQEGSKPQNIQTSQASDRHALSRQSNSNQSLYGCKQHAQRC